MTDDDVTKEDLEARRRGELHLELLEIVEAIDALTPGVGCNAADFLGAMLSVIRSRGVAWVRQAVTGDAVRTHPACRLVDLVEEHGTQDVAWMLLVIKADQEELATDSVEALRARSGVR